MCVQCQRRCNLQTREATYFLVKRNMVEKVKRGGGHIDVGGMYVHGEHSHRTSQIVGDLTPESRCRPTSPLVGSPRKMIARGEWESVSSEIPGIGVEIAFVSPQSAVLLGQNTVFSRLRGGYLGQNSIFFPGCSLILQQGGILIQYCVSGGNYI